MSLVLALLSCGDPGLTEPREGPPSEVCEAGGEPVEIDVKVRSGPRTNQFELAVRGSRRAAVSTLCEADDDSGEVILVESPAGLDHLLRLSGLRPETAYTCLVAPICPMSDAPPREVSVVAGETPIAFTPLQVEVDAELGSDAEWTLIGRPDEGSGDSWIVIFDAEGRPRWWEPLPHFLQAIEILHHPEDDVIVWGGGARRTGPGEGRPAVVSMWEGTTRVDVPGWQDVKFTHDGVRLDDGRFLTLEVPPNVGPDGSEWKGFGATVYDPVLERIDFAIDSQRYVDGGQLPLPTTDAEGPYHANWAHYADTPEGPTLWISLCELERILAIDGVTGDIRWQLGLDLGWTVLDEGGAPLPEAALPSCQHGLEVDGDELLVYDNGRRRRRSMASRWRVDADAQIAQRLWSWTEEGWFLARLGDIDFLGPDRVSVTMARFGPERNGNTEIVEVDVETGRVASRRGFRTNGAGYRSELLGGCALFDRVDRCAALAERRSELAPVFGRP